MNSSRNLWFLNFSQVLLGVDAGQILVRVSGQCVFCQKTTAVVLNPEQFDVACSGNLRPIRAIRDREFLISGICHSCQIGAFEEEAPDDYPQEAGLELGAKAYVTNAVARSVAFYAMTYLNQSGYNDQEIRELRMKLALENLAAARFTIDELAGSFAKQSAFFLNLYKQLTEGEFCRFAEALAQGGRFRSVFGRYRDHADLIDRFKRRIFHTSLDCEWMRHDYREEVFHPNTGVFHEKVARKVSGYYVVNVDYLQEMGMQPCKKCLA